MSKIVSNNFNLLINPLILKPDKLHDEKVRLITFRDWPPDAKGFPIALAREGFCYTGPGDQVQCVFCKGLIKNWKSGDIPTEQHKRYFPECSFVQKLEVGNVPILGDQAPGLSYKIGNKEAVTELPEQVNGCLKSNPLVSQNLNCGPDVTNGCEEAPKYPQYATLIRRIDSFKHGTVSPGQTAEGLANAGFFFVGPNDKVMCYHCGGNLLNWKPSDDPCDEHVKWYRNCSYIRAIRQQTRPVTSLKNLKSAANGSFHNEPREISAIFDTQMVRAILDMGYSQKLVRRAIKTRFLKTGDDFPNAESLLDAILTMQEESVDERMRSTNDLAHGIETQLSPPQEKFSKTSHSAVEVNHKTHQTVEENHILREARICKVCMEKEVNIVFLPCGHLVCCSDCSQTLSDCPICRVSIDSKLKTFLS